MKNINKQFKSFFLYTIAIAMILLAITLTIIAALPEYQAPPMGSNEISTDSETAPNIFSAKKWAQLQANPDGWIALMKGYNKETIYLLIRKEPIWRGLLIFGQIATVLGLITLGYILLKRLSNRPMS